MAKFCNESALALLSISFGHAKRAKRRDAFCSPLFFLRAESIPISRSTQTSPEIIFLCTNFSVANKVNFYVEHNCFKNKSSR